MKKCYLIISDNSYIVQIESPNGNIRYNKGCLEIFSSSNKALEDIEKILKQLKLAYQYNKVEHILKVLCNSVLSNYVIYTSNEKLI